MMMMHPNLSYFFLICLSTLNVLCLQGQTDSLNLASPDLTDTLELTQETDTSLRADRFLADSILVDSTLINVAESEKDSTKYHANKALMWSALFPGGGQFYNKQYVKAPIFPALVGSGVYFRGI